MIGKKRPATLETFIGFIVLIAGADIAIMFSKIPFWVGIILLVIGLLLILHSFGFIEVSRLRQLLLRGNKYLIAQDREIDTIARKIIRKLTLDGKIIPVSYPIGILLIVLVVFYNSYISINKNLGTYDLILILLACGLLIYPLIWRVFPKEADFILCFFFILAIEIIPAIALMGSDDAIANSGFGNLYIQLAVILPVVGLLSISGIVVSSSGSIINFVMQDGTHGSVGIAVSCSGIYSTMIFIAAFVAFILSFYDRWEKKLTYLLIIGILAAYLANILRIYLVIISGYFNGMGNPNDPALFTLLWTHKYAGEIIFICWIALFWWLAFRYFAPTMDRKQNGDK